MVLAYDVYSWFLIFDVNVDLNQDLLFDNKRFASWVN